MDSVNQSISRLLEAQVSWNARNEVDEEVAPRQPATDADIDGLSKALGHGLPPSYEQLLRTHDGIAGAFGIDGEFLSSRYRGEYDDQWADCTELAGCPPQSEMLFFAMDDDGSAAAFDKTTRDARGEMEVVIITNYRELARFGSLPAYLAARVNLLEASP